MNTNNKPKNLEEVLKKIADNIYVSGYAQGQHEVPYAAAEKAFNLFWNEGNPKTQSWKAEIHQAVQEWAEGAIPGKTIVPVLDSGNLSDYHEGWNDCLDEIKSRMLAALEGEGE